MSNNQEVHILKVEGSDREAFDPILDKSFEGWYQRHAKRTLREIETVFAANLGEKGAGVSMLKKLDSNTGYVYYIAVDPEFRGKKIGSKLLDASLDFFFKEGANSVFASLVQEHDEGNFLFESRGFRRTNFKEVSKRYGSLHAVNMYRKMLVVTGEVVVFKDLVKPL
ncbi:MAG: GNAT family N-acetyltransferase [Nitrososphaerota archaeon]|nr:GNAT family N-acetyltransferase [Nitrososphaerota archaeon]